jgi:hypothetical protein
VNTCLWFGVWGLGFGVFGFRVQGIVPACHRLAQLRMVNTNCHVTLSEFFLHSTAAPGAKYKAWTVAFSLVSSSRVVAATESLAAQGAQYLRLMMELSNSKKNTLKSFNAEVKHAICSSLTSSLSLLPSSRRPSFEPVACLDDALEVSPTQTLYPHHHNNSEGGKIDQCIHTPETMNILAGCMGGCCPMGG